MTHKSTLINLLKVVEILLCPSIVADKLFNLGV